MKLLNVLSNRPWCQGVRSLAATIFVAVKRGRESVRDR
jgi:hypothetical protein